MQCCAQSNLDTIATPDCGQYQQPTVTLRPTNFSNSPPALHKTQVLYIHAHSKRCHAWYCRTQTNHKLITTVCITRTTGSIFKPRFLRNIRGCQSKTNDMIYNTKYQVLFFAELSTGYFQRPKYCCNPSARKRLAACGSVEICAQR